MNPLVTISVVLGIIGIVGLLAYFSYKAEKRRTEELKRVADSLGFDFAPQGDPAFFQTLNRFHLFSEGHGKKLWNLLRGKSNDLEMAIFDYRYVASSGKSNKTWTQSVIWFRLEGADLPAFSLRPESVWNKIGSWLGSQDIDFESHPAFSSNYLLRGSDENAIRQLFSDALLDFYDRKAGLSTEGAGDTLLYYQHSRRIEAEAIRSFIEDGFKVARLFQSNP